MRNSANNPEPKQTSNSFWFGSQWCEYIDAKTNVGPKSNTIGKKVVPYFAPRTMMYPHMTKIDKAPTVVTVQNQDSFSPNWPVILFDVWGTFLSHLWHPVTSGQDWAPELFGWLWLTCTKNQPNRFRNLADVIIHVIVWHRHQCFANFIYFCSWRVQSSSLPQLAWEASFGSQPQWACYPRHRPQLEPAATNGKAVARPVGPVLQGRLAGLGLAGLSRIPQEGQILRDHHTSRCGMISPFCGTNVLKSSKVKVLFCFQKINHY